MTGAQHCVSFGVSPDQSSQTVFHRFFLGGVLMICFLGIWFREVFLSVFHVCYRCFPWFSLVCPLVFLGCFRLSYFICWLFCLHGFHFLIFFVYILFFVCFHCFSVGLSCMFVTFSFFLRVVVALLIIFLFTFIDFSRCFIGFLRTKSCCCGGYSHRRDADNRSSGFAC